MLIIDKYEGVCRWIDMLLSETELNNIIYDYCFDQNIYSMALRLRDAVIDKGSLTGCNVQFYLTMILFND